MSRVEQTTVKTILDGNVELEPYVMTRGQLVILLSGELVTFEADHPGCFSGVKLCSILKDDLDSNDRRSSPM